MGQRLWISHNMLAENHLIEAVMVRWDLRLLGRQFPWKDDSLSYNVLTPQFSVPPMPQVFCAFLISHISERVEVASPR